MICKTVRKGRECSFQKTKGCIIEGCVQATERCGTCKKIKDGFCSVYPHPAVIWSYLGGCPLDTNKVIKEESKKKINPLKASKNKMKKGII